MKQSLRDKLQHLVERYEQVAQLLSSPDVINDQNRYKELSKEYAQLEPVVQAYNEFKHTEETITQSEELLKEADAEMKELAKAELEEAQEKLTDIQQTIRTLLLPVDPYDQNNVFLEIRAGTGGDEAAIFVGDLYRMYTRYAELKHWKVEVMAEHTSEQGGYKEIILRMIGQGAYSQLKFESGAHRVQRVPVTESQGRVHTSACTVAVLPEIDEVEAIDINPADLRIDTYRASGAGGQHVNRTDSAVRITHLPTGVVVECQDERSQHKNKARAMSVLQSRLITAERDKQRAEEAQTRRNLVGSGDRSERIRTYNFPQGRLTDHRINLTLYKLDDIMEGQLEQVIDPLIREHQADLLASMGEDES